MRKVKLKYILAPLVLIAILATLEALKKTPLDWGESYQTKDKNPYGQYFLNEALPYFFPNQKIIYSKKDLHRSLNQDASEKQSLIIINSFFDPDTLGNRALYDFIKDGNEAFIAAHSFKSSWLDSIVKVKRNYTFFHNTSDSLNYILINNQKFYYALKNNSYYFDSIPNGAKILAKTHLKEEQVPNFIQINVGKGKLFLNLFPKAFTNYNFLDSNKREYIALNWENLTAPSIIWDEYYFAQKNAKDTNVTAVFHQNPGLSYALQLLFFIALCYLFFESKRKQRIIPILKPLKNSSQEFVTTIAAMHMENKNSSPTIIHLRTFLMQDILKKYGLPFDQINDQYYKKLSEVSEIDFAWIKSKFDYLWQFDGKTISKEEDLIKANLIYEQFHQKAK